MTGLLFPTGRPIQQRLEPDEVDFDHTTDAKERIKAARKDATHVWAEQALDIAERPATTTAEVQQARLQIETRRWLAGIFNREEFSEKQHHDVTLDLGQLHLAALRARAVQQAQLQPVQVAASSGTTAQALLRSGEAQHD